MTDTELPRFYRQREEGGGWKVINRATRSPIGFQFADITNAAKAVELANQVYQIALIDRPEGFAIQPPKYQL